MVRWNGGAAVYGPYGVTTAGLTLVTSGTYGEQLELTVTSSVLGQVVLDVSFPSTSGMTVVGAPQVVFDRPPGTAITGVSVFPSVIESEKDVEVPLELWSIYDGTTWSRAFVSSTNTVFASSNEAVATVDTEGRVKLVQLGVATITAAYQGIHTGTASVTVVDAVPLITSAATVPGTTGQSLNYQITASQAVDAFAADSLPAGLSLNSQNGLVSGNPTTQGRFSVMLSASNANGLGHKQVQFVIAGPPGVPTDLGLNVASISENKPIGTLVGSFSTIDPNPLDTFGYQLVSGTGATNNSLFTIAGNQLISAAVLNHTTQPSVSIRVRSTDSSGLSVEKVIVLPVLAPPAITRQPESREVFVGDGVTFFVETTGVEPLSYQWWKGSQPVPNANSRILELSDVAFTDAGIYTVTVSNGDGSVTSTAASLLVDPVSYGKWASSLPQTVASALLEPNADYNNDGVMNLLDFALGLSPNLSSAGQLPQPQRVGNNLVISFIQPAGISGITYGAEWSTTLLAGSWTAIPDTGIPPQHTFSVPMGTYPSLFMRLKVTSNANFTSTSFTNWQVQNFTAAQLGDPTISGDMAAPAGDGVPNLMKYALGMNPAINSRTGLPVSGTAIVSGSDYLTLTYIKRKNATDISYHPEWSTDLSTWFDAGPGEQVLSDDGVFQEVLDSPYPNSFPRVFMRLRVTRP